MKSIQISLKSLSIHFILTSMLILSAYCDHKAKFINYYSSRTENKFFATYSLSKLNQAHRQNICNLLSRPENQGIYITNNEILLADVTVRHLTIKEVPAFQCASIETSFYTTFVPSDLYFILEFNSSTTMPPYVIEAQIMSSRNIPSYAVNQRDIRRQIYEYFRSAEYVAAAHEAINPYYQTSTWRNLCAMFDIVADPDPLRNLARAPTTSLTTVNGRQITNDNVPVILCPTDNRDIDIVIYFVGGIFFLNREYTELDLSTITLVRPDYRNDTDLTVTPSLHQLPPELVDIIQHRRRQ